MLCIINIVCFPFCGSPIFQNKEVNTKHCSHKWLWEITILLYMRSTHCTSRKCNSGDIISNLLLSRAYFPHLFHMISGKAKKASAPLRKPSRSGRWLGVLPFAEVRPRSEVNTCGSDLTLGSHTCACGNVA